MGSDEAMRAVVSQEVVDLLYLCGRALAGEAAELERVSRMDLARVHALAVTQSLSALAYYGLESAFAGGTAPSAPLAAWRSERDKSVRRQLLFGAERAQILAWMRANGIWYALLKGAVLADWYPRVGMREFSDNDILYDASRRADLARFFRERGYARNAEGHAAGMDDSFSKEPVYRFEMHRRMFSGYSSPAIARYFDDVEERLIAEEGSPCARRLSCEDFYLYLIAHAFKHHNSGGTGVRILCDMRVFHEHVGAELDGDYVARELAALGLAEFAGSLERLAASVFERGFDPAELCDEDSEVLCALTSYGTYGTVEHQAELKVERKEQQGISNGRYLFRRFVPDDAWWDANFPFANKHRWARVPLLLFRYARAVVEPERRARIVAEVKALLHRK